MRGRVGIANFFILAGIGFAVAGWLAVTSGTLGGSITGSTFLMIGGIWALVGLGVRAMYARMRARAMAEQQLFQTGTKATAVVEGVETTGTVLNDVNVKIILRLRVQPRFEPEFVHEREIYVPMHSLPRTGDLIEVAYDPNDRSRVALATDWRSDTAGGRQLILRRPDEAPSGTAEGWETATALDAAYSGQDASSAASGDESSAERIIEQLERLHRLKQDGALTEAEFEQQKARLLSEQGG